MKRDLLEEQNEVLNNSMYFDEYGYAVDEKWDSAYEIKETETSWIILNGAIYGIGEFLKTDYSMEEALKKFIDANCED